MAVWFNATSFFHVFKVFSDFSRHKRLANITKMLQHLLKQFHLESIVLYIGDFLCNFLWSVSLDWSIIISKYSIFSSSISIMRVEIAVAIVFVLFALFVTAHVNCSDISSERSRTLGMEATIAWVIIILIYSWNGSIATLHGHWRSTKSSFISVLLVCKSL